jgi:hypothetical protein
MSATPQLTKTQVVLTEFFWLLTAELRKPFTTRDNSLKALPGGIDDKRKNKTK